MDAIESGDALYKLQSWLSPAYPVGAYAFSHGLENAVERGFVSGAATAAEWIDDIITVGNGFADLVFVRAAWQASGDDAQTAEVTNYALAFQVSCELRTETIAQGDAFLRVTADAWPGERIAALRAATSDGCPYPVAVGVAAAAHNIDCRTAMTAYGHAFVSNLVSAAVRLIPLGQTDGQRIVADLAASVSRAVNRAIETPLDRIATSTPMADITSMNHETQYTRLFRS